MSIKNIISSETDLNTNRISQIKDLIKPIAANKNIFPKRVPAFQNDSKIIFCVTENPRITDLNQFSNHSNINERFKTINPKFLASYYEMWDKQIESKQTYKLNRIYFHLYTSAEDKEYILLHTDPSDNDIKHGNYKRSPHLHIKHTNDDNISHAHFALNINDYDVALSSLNEIQKCFKNHIEMLSHQILNINK